MLLGSPADAVLTPWFTSLFSFWDASFNVIPMTQQTVYLNDTIGLATLASLGRLHLQQVDGVCFSLSPLSLSLSLSPAV